MKHFKDHVKITDNLYFGEWCEKFAIYNKIWNQDFSEYDYSNINLYLKSNLIKQNNKFLEIAVFENKIDNKLANKLLNHKRNIETNDKDYF